MIWFGDRLHIKNVLKVKKQELIILIDKNHNNDYELVVKVN